MEYEQILEKVKEHNDIELYEAISEMKKNNDKALSDKEEELKKSKEEQKKKEDELKQAQDKVWEYIMRGEKEKKEFKKNSPSKPKTIDDYFK